MNSRLGGLGPSLQRRSKDVKAMREQVYNHDHTFGGMRER